MNPVVSYDCPFHLMRCHVDRVQRLKDAKIEAAKEIETIKAQKAREFAEHEKQVSNIEMPINVSADAHFE